MKCKRMNDVSYNNFNGWIFCYKQLYVTRLNLFQKIEKRLHFNSKSQVASITNSRNDIRF